MKNKLYILVSIIFMLGNWGLTESSDARYAKIAREMIIGGLH
jgi:4-amino-4-deoxy-L-arabinose transferase